MLFHPTNEIRYGPSAQKLPDAVEQLAPANLEPVKMDDLDGSGASPQSDFPAAAKN